jgi:DNA primase
MAGRIPEKFIEDLMTRVDIVDVIDSRVPLKKAGKDYKACCPFHEEKTPSFTVSPDKQFYHCFGCGEHGTAIGFLMNYDRMSFPEAVRELAARVGMEVPQEAQSTQSESGSGSQRLLELLTQADKFFQKQLREHPDAGKTTGYLKGRGLSGEIAAEFGVGFAPAGWDNLLKAIGKDEQTREDMVVAGLAVRKDNGGYYDRFRDRVMFPIHDYRGRIVGFGGRILPPSEPDAQGDATEQKSGAAKYLNSPETPVFHKGREVYGLFWARDGIKREQRVLVVEGYMDVVALTQFGIDYAVATLGTATTRDHLERLFRFSPEVVFAFDGDRAGREAAWRALENVLPIMSSGRQVSFLFLPDGEDPDSLVRKEGQEKFAERIRSAKPLGEYLVDALADKVDLERMDGRARLVDLATPLIEKLPDGIFRQMLVDRLAQKSRVKTEKLSTLLGNSQQAASSRREGSRRPRAGGLTQKPTLMRHAIALVLQHPQLASLADGDEIESFDIAGAPLLAKVLHLAAEMPNCTTGHLVERFRDTEHFGPIQKLAMWADPVAEVEDGKRDLEMEFQDVLLRLRKQGIKDRLDNLHARELKDLSASERQEIVQLGRELAALDNSGANSEADSKKG